MEERVAFENSHDLDGVLGTFGEDAHYDDTAWSERHDGREAVRGYYEALMTAAPDLHIEILRRHVTDEVVVLECLISGTHLGVWRQLGVLHEPQTLRGRMATAITHPVTLGRAVAAQRCAGVPPGARKARHALFGVGGGVGDDALHDVGRLLAADNVEPELEPVMGERAAPMLPVDPQRIDETGLPWAFLSDAARSDEILPGAPARSSTWPGHATTPSSGQGWIVKAVAASGLPTSGCRAAKTAMSSGSAASRH